MVICIQILPLNYLYLVCGGAPHQIQLIFASFQPKMPRKIFFVALGGAPAPPALPPPGYAYGG